jgi:hypothetical protein
MITTAALPDALRDALGQVIANERREWRRERELIEAQSRETIAELRARIVELEAKAERAVGERLAAVRDGSDGEPGPPGRDGIDGKAGRDGVDGKDGRDGIDGAPGEKGADGLPGPAGAPGVRGEPGMRGEKGEPGERGERGLDGAPGERGERGPEGPPGKLPLVRAWSEGVHYEGDVVIHAGATWQALRDTAREPPHAEWAPLALPGQDGRAPDIRGTYSADEAYRRLDIVALNGGSFVALRDDPGPCPGAGWQLLASAGKRGERGDKGERGERGLEGKPGNPGKNARQIIGFKALPDYRAVLVFEDGALSEPHDVRSWFEQYETETRG